MIDSKKVELLSPAGDMECLEAALKGGADAIYLAGKRFGARASAKNFEDDELLRALDMAHVHDKKIYLTLNTLIKQREYDGIYDYLSPLYERGLDGIIIQDLGLIDMLRTCFPGLSVHASTQMTITHSKSVKLLLDRGIDRVVLSRELSLDEISTIKKNTGADMEVFVHGAMCYSYSGACLFSSFLGGRSGNRGRCAGPCRLPYDGDKYCLSLHDMCLLDRLGDLINAGVNSFKIEGRLKDPVYVYGVTNVYRKYIDRYYDGLNDEVDPKDKNMLNDLYLRGGYSGGYLDRHNGRDMITIDSPSYRGMNKETEDIVQDSIRGTICSEKARCYAVFHVKHPMKMTLVHDTGVSITVEGKIVEKAQKCAASYEEIKERLSKSGGTGFTVTVEEIELDDDCFIPVGEVNALRREAIELLRSEILKKYHREKSTVSYNDFCGKRLDVKITDHDGNAGDKVNEYEKGRNGLTVLIRDPIQFDTVFLIDPARIYIPYDLIYLNEVSFDSIKKAKSIHKDTEIYLKLPRIYRKRSDGYMARFLADLIDNRDCIDGVLVCNLEELEPVYDICRSDDIMIAADHSLYAWNDESKRFILSYADNITAPLELSLHELNDIDDLSQYEMVIYGKAPLMVSANCLKKTLETCGGDANSFIGPLKDRYGKKEAVFANCVHCYNEIYNALPTSLHKKMKDVLRSGFCAYRIELTDESKDETYRLIKYFDHMINRNGDVQDITADETDRFPIKDFTGGHMDKGAI